MRPAPVSGRPASPDGRPDFSDAHFPGHTFKGHVESISPATGATFSLLPKDTSSGNFTKVVQRIPVRIAFEPGQERLPEIRSGMSVITRIDTGSDQTGA